MSIIIPAKLIRAALIFTAKQDVRYYLNGLRLEVTGEREFYLAATDGHRMFAVRHEQEQPIAEELRRTFILERGGLAAVGQRALSLIIERMESESEVVARVTATPARSRYLQPETTSKRIFCGVVDGKYPNWRKVLAEAISASDAHAEFNAEYLADVDKAQRILSGYKHALTTVMRKGRDNAGVISFGPGLQAVAVVMPLRWDSHPKLPQWASDLTEPKA